MTKRWLSLVLVLTLMSSLFAGGAMAAPSAKAMYPEITFKPVPSVIYVDEAATESTIQLGTFFVEGVKANSAVSALIKSNLIKTIALGSTTLMLAVPADAAKVNVNNGVLEVKYTAPALSVVAADLTVKASMTYNTIANDVLDGKYDVVKVKADLDDFADITLCPPIASLALSAVDKVSGKSISNASGKFTTVTGKEADTVVLTATAKDANNSDLDSPKFYAVTWTSDNEDVATVASSLVSDKGTGTVSTVGAGVANITATAKNDREVKTVSWRIIVDQVLPTSLTVATVPGAVSTKQTIKPNQQLQLTAAPDAAATTPTTITWRSSDSTRATVDSNGLVKGVKAGTGIRIYASTTNDIEGSIEIDVDGTITTPIAPTFAIDNVVPQATSSAYTVAKELKILSNQENSSIYYVLSDKDISGITTEAQVKENGQLYTGPISVAKDGTYTVKAVAYVNNEASAVVSDDFKIELAVKSVKLDKVSKVTINGQQEIKVTATVLPAGISSARLATLAWTFEDPSTATAAELATKVDAADRLSTTVTTTGKKGTFTLKAALEGKYDECAFEVVTIDATGISANPTAITVAKGEKVKLTGVVAPSNASNQNFTYMLADGSQSNDNVALAVVDAGDATKGVYVIGKKAGSSDTVLVIHPEGRRVSVPVTVTTENSVVAAPTFNKPDKSVFTDASTSIVLSSATDNVEIYYTLNGEDPRYAIAPARKTFSTTPIAITLGQKEVTIKAYAVDNASEKADSPVVTATYFAPISVKGVSLDLSKKTLAGTGATFVLTATFDPTTPTTTELTWTSSNEDVAKVASTNATIPTAQTATIKSGKPGTATITVTTKDGNKTATCDVTVNEQKPIGITAINNAATSAALAKTGAARVGETVQLKAVFNPLETTNQDVRWTSSNEGIATIDANGVLTGHAAGTINITVTSVANTSNGIPAVFTYTDVVVAAASNDVKPPEFTSDPAVAIGVDATTEITVKMTSPTVGATVYYTTDGSVPTDKSTVAPSAGIKLSANTFFRAIAIKDGKSSAVANRNYTFDIPATKVTLNTKVATLKVKETLQLSATVTPDNATDKTVVYSGGTGVAKVDANGLVTALATGQVTLTATVGTVTDTVVIQVIEAPVTSVALAPNAASVTIGEKLKLLPTIAPVEAAGTTLAWSSNNSDVAAVNTNGEVTAAKAGTAIITATAPGGSVKGTATITVVADPSVLPQQPTNLPTFVPTTKTFEAIEGSSFSKVIGKFDAGTGQTWEQIQYYYTVKFTPTYTPAGKINFVVGNDGTVTLYITDAGTYTRDFDYKWELEWKSARGANPNTLHGSGRHVTGNTLTITNKPTSINYVNNTPPTYDVPGTSGSVDMGTIGNRADFAATGIALTATVDATRTGDAPKATVAGFSASVGSDGKVTLNINNVATGVYDVFVTISAEGCADVKTGTVQVTVKEEPIPPTKGIKVTSSTKPYETSYKKKPVYVLAIADGTVTFSVPGYTATGWKSNYPKLLSIDANGVATLKKGGATRITVTATLSDGTKVTQLVLIRKIASEVKLQYKSGKKWFDFSESNPLTIGIGAKKKVLTRAIVVTPAGGKVFAPKWEFSNPAIAFRGSKGYINGSVVGESIVTYELYNGVKATGLVIVSASKTADLIDELDLDVIEELETEEIEEIVEVEDDQEIEDVEVIEEIEETEAE